MPRWRERRVRRRRNAGRTGDGPGLPLAPGAHCRTRARRCVRPSRAVCVISVAWGFGRGVEPASGGGRGPARSPRRACSVGVRLLGAAVGAHGAGSESRNGTSRSAFAGRGPSPEPATLLSSCRLHFLILSQSSCFLAPHVTKKHAILYNHHE